MNVEDLVTPVARAIILRAPERKLSEVPMNAALAGESASSFRDVGLAKTAYRYLFLTPVVPRVAHNGTTNNRFIGFVTLKIPLCRSLRSPTL
jgi:hypothetical protein